MRREILPAGVALMLFGATDASAQALRSAQDAQIDLFVRNRAVAVRDRPQPSYDPLGIRAGGFTTFPRLQSGVVQNDNVFAAEDDRQPATTLRLTPEVLVRSNWSRHALETRARAEIDRNLDFDSENTTDWSLGGAGRLDIVRGADITLAADYAHDHEARTAAGAGPVARRPIAFDLASASLAATRTRGPLRLRADAAVLRYDYRDGLSAAGAVIEQDDRDRTVVRLTGRADYALSPATALFVQIARDDRDYRIVSGSPERSSSGHEALAGVDFELGALIRGEVAAGYIRQDFQNAAYGDLDGFGGRARLSWFPTQLTTLTAAAGRSVEDTGVIGSAGALRTDVSISADHELLRNLILTAETAWSEDDYNGLDRSDTRFTAGFSAVYRLNRRYGLTAGLTYLDQSSSGAVAGPSYHSTRLSVAVVSQF
ncbi:outer membrane beta-barrel protein [Brevundimonas vesicularis]|uniref:outer membrane beta-barrel protein n=1 Tax=Brevundimonas vesicularis TaxID=41276 RepID=UPI0022EC331E|nr:outer membrane beta-barrel protein [Brevundimonas vesicularis]WBT05654.1 outer membrane beta-barrel protein [Brevundimonas vesicularis]